MDGTEGLHELGFGEQTHYRWRRAYCGMDVNDARPQRELERENARLMRFVEEQALDIAILKEAFQGDS